MIMNLASLFLLSASVPLSNAWTASPIVNPARLSSTRLQMGEEQQQEETGRRAFFRHVGAIVGSTTTIVAGPWIARANDDLVEQEPSSSSSPKDDVVLIAEEVVAEAPPVLTAEQVLVADSDTEQKPDEDKVVEVVEPKTATFVENKKAVEDSATALNAKIEESMEEESSSSAAAPMIAEAKKEEPSIVATIDPNNKIFQDLFDERKAVSSDADLDAFCKELRGLIAADSGFADSFEAFLDKMSTARA
jgi:hypothetical protein